MDDRMPWPFRTAVLALTLVLAVWVVGFALLWAGSPLGGLAAGIGAWLTVGLVATAWRTPQGPAS
ncbi:hypothetical protein DCC79_01045 [bacterium]|nr:hypothetical protein [Chloroflexi bacterium CFX6]RIL12583.1 MAG: hypothetical protein DCC79_01045 [bacterium]